MPFITVPDGTEIFYKDWGPKDAQPIVFHHGWPLSADDWDNQMMFFLARATGSIAHDRRGHGRSTQTDTGNDMDTYAEDVKALAARARPQERHPCRPFDRRRRSRALCRARRAGRVAKAVLIGAVPPVMLKTRRQSRRPAARGVRRLSRRRWRAIGRSSTSISRPDPFYGFNRTGRTADRRA